MTFEQIILYDLKDVFGRGPAFVDFRNVSDEAHRTTKFLDKRRFKISKYVRVNYGTILVV